jgi:hypothetical protein
MGTAAHADGPGDIKWQRDRPITNPHRGGAPPFHLLSTDVRELR